MAFIPMKFFWLLSAFVSVADAGQTSHLSSDRTSVFSLAERSDSCQKDAAQYFVAGDRPLNSSKSNWLDGVEPPICMEEKAEKVCSKFTTQWLNSILNATELPDSTQTQLRTNETSLVLDRSAFCNVSFTNISNACRSSCDQAAEQNDFLFWINRTCAGHCSFTNFPTDWKQQLTVVSNLVLYAIPIHSDPQKCLTLLLFTFIRNVLRV